MVKPLPREKIFYAALITVLSISSIYFAYEIREDFNVTEFTQRKRAEIMLWLVPLKLVILYAFGQFEVLAARFRAYDFYKLATALGLNAAFLLYLWFVFDGRNCPPRSVILIDFMLSLLALGGFRALIQFFRGEALGINEKTGFRSKRVAIIGAGFVGCGLARELTAKRGFGMRPVAFLDDDPAKLGLSFNGIRVVGNLEALNALAARYDLDRLIIAQPAITPRKIREILLQARRLKLDVLIVPSPQELLYGQIRADQLRPIELDDFLDRGTLDVNSLQIHELISQRVVMVTGAGGSIGSELSRQIAAKNPSRLLLVEQSEAALFQIEQFLHAEGFGSSILPLLADIRDQKRMEYILERYRPSIIFHSAAYKHVPLVENQPAEGVKNNTLATADLARLAAKYKVEKFVLISSDKAINPSSAMGACKRLAEIYLQALQNNPQINTQFMAVRFGNVLGSSGSVVPIFKRQILEGGPVTVTHPEVTRFFMSIPEAVGLVLQAAALGRGGDIFVLDMGQPIKVVDLARQLIELHGFEPEKDIEIKFVGLRPGEKLYEELHHKGEYVEKTPHSRILRYVSQPENLSILEEQLNSLAKDLDHLDRNQVKQRIQEIVPEYTPFLD